VKQSATALRQETLRETVKVEKFVLPDAALPEAEVIEVIEVKAAVESGARAAVRAPLAEPLPPPTLDEERAARFVAAGLWIVAAAMIAALWLLTN